jgi:hypothetical protein
LYQLQDQAIIDFLLFKMPPAESLNDAQRAVRETFVQGGLKHPRQGRHQPGQRIKWQYDSVDRAVDRRQVEAYLCSARHHVPTCQLLALDWQGAGRRDPHRLLPILRYSHMDIA